jgi:hypothetical protein
VRVDVDQARQEHRALRLDDARAGKRGEIRSGVAPDARDDPALDDDVDLGVERALRIDGAHAAEDEDVAHRRARSSKPTRRCHPSHSHRVKPRAMVFAARAMVSRT